MIIIGIDPGLATIGYGIIDYDNKKKVKINRSNIAKFVKYLDCGSIITKSNLSIGERLCSIQKQVEQLLKKYQPDCLGVERVFFYNNQRTLIVVSQATGIIIFTGAKLKIPIYEMTPSEIKFFITNNGRADKKEMQKLTKEIFPKKKLSKLDDPIDALSVALLCVFKHHNY